jgi:hypothetical protein
MLRFRRAFPAGPLEGITVEIGDRCPTALDLRYARYRNYISQHYGFEPAPLPVWLKVDRGISSRSRSTTGIRLQNPAEHRKAQSMRVAATGLETLS